MPNRGVSSRVRAVESTSPYLKRNSFFSQCRRYGCWRESKPHGPAVNIGELPIIEESEV
jgi:hypothetical protein